MIEAIILILLVVIVVHQLFSDKLEGLVEGFVDPYSLCLHSRALDKQHWWDMTHSRKMYEMRPYTFQIYRE